MMMDKKKIAKAAIVATMLLTAPSIINAPQAVAQVYVPKNYWKYYCWGGGYCDCTLPNGNCLIYG